MEYRLLILVVLIQLAAILSKNNAMYFSYVYDISPASFSFDKRCISNNIEFARSVKYQGQSNNCEKLSQTWNTNRTFESGFVYALMRWYESPFAEALVKAVSFPNNFGLDCRIDVIVETTDVIQDGYYMNIEDPINAERYVHLRISPLDGRAVLNTKVNGTWLTEISVSIDDAANHTYTEYTSTFILKSTHWEIYVDGTFLCNFMHVHPYSGTGSVYFESITGDVLCKRMVFYGP